MPVSFLKSKEEFHCGSSGWESEWRVVGGIGKVVGIFGLDRF
jgi:hypothetical protein